MRKLSFLLLLKLAFVQAAMSQGTMPTDKQNRDISALIDSYSKARENSDTILLKKILSKDVDQLVSTGEWRNGIGAAVEGMLKSSANSPGTRTLQVDKVRMINTSCGVVDCRYTIQNPGGVTRKMWSTFIVVADKGSWVITAIRNMLPEERRQ